MIRCRQRPDSIYLTDVLIARELSMLSVAGQRSYIHLVRVSLFVPTSGLRMLPPAVFAYVIAHHDSFEVT